MLSFIFYYISILEVLSIIEVINKYWVQFNYFFSSLFCLEFQFFSILTQNKHLCPLRITILFDDKFNLENVIKLKNLFPIIRLNILLI